MNDDRLAFLNTKADIAAKHARSAKYLRIIRYSLIFGILTLLTVLVLWPQLSQIETQPLSRTDLEALKQAETENTLRNPVFNSRDSKGRPFTIIADEALQNREDTHIIYLTNPTAKLSTDRDGVIELKAEAGVLNQSSQILTLQNNVVLAMDIVTIEGSTLILDQNNQTVTFQGPTKAVITKGKEL
jgi:hypothetical protein